MTETELAIAVANEAAFEMGVVPTESLITISEEPATPTRVWRIHYGPRDYLLRRGGDLIVLVDEQTASVQQVIRGQ